MATILFVDLSPGLRLVVNGHVEPEQAEWDAMLKIIQQRSKLPQDRTLVISGGGSPTLKQRKALDAVLKAIATQVRTSLVTTSPAVRALMTAVGWMSKNDLRAFAPTELAKAFSYLELTHAEIEQMQPHIDTMCRTLNVRILDQLTKAAS